MYRIIFLFLYFIPRSYSNEGFTWISQIKETVGLPEHVITYLLISLLAIMIAFLYRKKLSKVLNPIIPDSKISLRSLVELYGDFIYSQSTMIMGEEKSKQYFSFFCSLFIVIFFSNIIGIIPGFLPPTEHMSTTLALGLFSFIFYNYMGVKSNGIVNYLKHFAGPLWYMAFLIFPIEVISHLFRPLTLALRLRGNIWGDHIVLATFNDLAPWGVPVFVILFGMLVSFVQAYVFTTLSMVYISLAVSHD